MPPGLTSERLFAQGSVRNVKSSLPRLSLGSVALWLLLPGGGAGRALVGVVLGECYWLRFLAVCMRERPVRQVTMKAVLEWVL